ncbi:hypothetical protein DSO57_1013843 [Entomophthora muscae]|uniref:Uncharacterized protein n=1 Tax=Entomophthora muscae TaxID=34485 RepID=A0ACC2T5Q1_9FUNG|nr:hypothetical protein DSO57_1013843 [Entomophthora muscae]
MRFISLVFGSVSCVELMVVSPWADTVWKSGQEAVISFEVKPTKPDVKMDMISAELMSGDPLDGLTVSTIATDIPITHTNVAWTVPDFPMNSDYFIRIGNGEEWYFSHTFTIQGNGKTPLPSKPTPILDNNSLQYSSEESITPSKAKIEANSTLTESNDKPSNATKGSKSADDSKSSAALKTLVPGTAILLSAFLSL